MPGSMDGIKLAAYVILREHIYAKKRLMSTWFTSKIGGRTSRSERTTENYFDISMSDAVATFRDQAFPAK